MRALATLLVLFILLVGPGAGRYTPDEIGTTESITKNVTGTVAEVKRPLKRGDMIHQDETIVTAADSEAEFILEDQTKLAIGPNSSLVLDKFVYNPSRKNGEIVVNAVKGAFRFISGKSNKSAYKINSPLATIAVRGTTFDGFINDNGEIAVLLVKGEVDVCNSRRACRTLKELGRFLHVGRNGQVSEPRKWDGSFFGNVQFDRAFPFIGRRLRIDQNLHFKRADLLGGRMRPGRQRSGPNDRRSPQRGGPPGNRGRPGGRGPGRGGPR